MAESVNSENPSRVYDLEEEDFFERFNLKRVKVLGKGMAGEVFLVKPKSGSGRMLEVKKFSLLEDVRERSMRQFSTEAGVMQVRKIIWNTLLKCKTILFKKKYPNLDSGIT